MKDSRGKQTKTLFFVAVTWAILVGKFALAGVTIGDFGTFPEMSGGEFAAAIGAVLGIWLGREYTEKVKVKDNDK